MENRKGVGKQRKTHNERPTPRKPRFILPINKHHPRHNSRIMLPAMSKLMPPFLLNHLVGRYLVDGPVFTVRIVKEYTLEDVRLVWDGGCRGGVVLSELMLVVCAARRGLGAAGKARGGVVLK